MKYSNGNAHKVYDRPQRLNPTPTQWRPTRRQKRKLRKTFGADWQRVVNELNAVERGG